VTGHRRIGILGGTFDPIHQGHLDTGRAAETSLGLTQVVIVPASVPPHRPQPLASSYHRFAMAAIAVAGLPGWLVSDIELCGTPPSFTTTTLQQFQQNGYLARELFFIIGSDAFTEIGTWRDYPGILERAHFAVVSRPGYPVGDLADRLPALQPRMRRGDYDLADVTRPVIFLIDAPTADVSSTAIRRRCREGHSLAGLVDPAVQQHIEQHGLYTSNAPDRRDAETSPTAGAGRLHGEG
jgi:nicotinate-nucleotide adenylyltransferase